MRVAIYARHSSNKQIRSTKDQIARCKAWCAQKKYLVSDVFFDEAISGANIQNRPGVHTLIQALLHNRFDRIVCEDLSRLSRDQEDIAAFYKKLLFLDIPLETITEGEINELHIGLKGTMNALYLKDLADKTRRGMIASVLNGSVPGGKTYGYDLLREYKDGQPSRGRRKINKEEAAIVRSIYQDYHNGQTLSQICTKLNRLAIPSPQGGKWIKTTLIGSAERKTGLLRQTLYKGVVTFNKMAYKRHPESGKRLSIIRPESEWIRVPLPELRILEEDLFDKVQCLIDKRSSISLARKKQRAVMNVDEKHEENRLAVKHHRTRQIKERRYNLQLISRKLHCADHDNSIRSIRSGVYNCIIKSCNNRNLRRAHLVDLTSKALKTFNIENLKVYLQGKEQEKNELLHQQSCLQQKLDSKRVKIRKLLDHFDTTVIRPETLRFLDEQEIDCQRLLFEINRFQKEIDNRTMLSDKNLSSIVKEFQKLLHKYDRDPENEQTLELLNSCISRINLTSVSDNSSKATTTINIDFDCGQILEILSRPYL